MEIKKKLAMPADKFYEQVMTSVLYDVREQTGKKLTEKQLANFEYVKQFSKKNRAKIKIEKVVHNRSYHFRTSTTKNDFQVRYEITPLDAQHCEVHYAEEMVSYGFLQKINDMIFGLLLKFFKKRQLSKMFELMEQSS